MVSQRIRDYELMMVISPESTDEEVAALSQRISGFVTDRGGSIYRDDHWGLRRLAYPIQRFQEGNYVLKQFSVDPETVVALGRTLNAAEQVLRHLMIKIEAPPPPPPPPPAPEPQAVAAEAEAETEPEPEAEEAPVSTEESSPEEVAPDDEAPEPEPNQA